MAVLEKAPINPKLEAQPLYARVRETLIARLISGQWKPGQMLPSEFAIAGELGVSQGTVRKALDEMTHEGLLTRQQGRGTFVAEAEDKSILFRFYRLTPNAADDEAAASFPESSYLSQIKDRATEQELDLFGLNGGEEVWRFERVRSDRAQPILWERLVLPCSRFPGISNDTILPNNVYQYYSANYGTIVARVKEELRAVSAPATVARLLKLPENTPVLEIDRRAIALDGQIVEWRVSLCRSDTMHYRNELK